MIVIDGREVIPGICFHSTPGHSVDHASIVLESAGAKALFTGDVFHHPVQVQAPKLLSIFDPDRETTLRSRKRVLDFATQQRAMLFTAHVPASSAGTVNAEGSEYARAFC